MELDFFQVDAFTDEAFAGNPAAVVPVGVWPEDRVLQAIAAENNLAETAFYRPIDGAYELRWFTPRVEVDLCGHATLASAHVLMAEQGLAGDSIRFETRFSGSLHVRRMDDGYELDFPVRPAAARPVPAALTEALGAAPEALFAEHKWMAVFADQAAVAALTPDMARVAALDAQGVIATAPGDAHDFVSRFFAPKVGVPEDPVTGSAHCVLTPYWAARLERGTTPMIARQISARGGEVGCRLDGDRVRMTGRAVTVIRGKLLF